MTKEEIKDKIDIRKVWIEQLEVKKSIWESEIKEFIDILNKQNERVNNNK